MLSRLNPLAVATDSRLDQRLEGEVARTGVLGATRAQGNVANVRKARHDDEACRLSERETPWRANLGRGCRMKQACEVRGGVSRRECEKHCGRNVRDAVGSVPGVDSSRSCREEGRDPKEGARCSRVPGRFRATSYSVEEASLREDEPVFARMRGTARVEMPRRLAGNSKVMAERGLTQ